MIRAALLLPALLSLSALSTANAPDGRPVRNSFVDRRVVDTADLLRHVRADAIVADRYVRHFAMDREAVLRFLGTLHRARLAKEGTFTIYSVPAGGRLKMHVGRIRKGEPMFFDLEGRPVLVVRCGNPVVLGPGRERKANRGPTTVDSDDRERILTASETLAPPDAALCLEPALPEVSIPTATAISVPPATEALDAVGALGVNGAPSWLSGLVVLIPIASEPWRPAPPKGPAPVPEPLTLFALTGAVGLLARRRRR